MPAAHEERHNGKSPTLESVNRHALKKLDELILSISAKDDPELLKAIVESLAKLNTSLRNNDIFAPTQTEDDRLEQAQKATLGEILSVER